MDYMTRHHLWFPKRWYRSEVERDFRELCCHIVQLPNSVHGNLHFHSDPPKVPDRAVMIRVIRNHIKDCLYCNTRLRNRRHYLEE